MDGANVPGYGRIMDGANVPGDCRIMDDENGNGRIMDGANVPSIIWLFRLKRPDNRFKTPMSG